MERMTSHRPRCASLCLAAQILGASLGAATIVPPRDLGELALRSDAVVLARALASIPFLRGPLVFTATEFAAEEPLSGPLLTGEVFTVEAPGGEAGGVVWAVPGSPRFEDGARYLLFLARKAPDDAGAPGAWIPAILSHGLLRETEGAGVSLLAPIPEAGTGGTLPRPDGEPVEDVVPYARDALLEHLERVLAGRSAWSASAVRAPDEWLPGTPHDPTPDSLRAAAGGGGGIPSQCSFLADGGRPFRWRAFDTGGSATISADATGDLSVATGGFDIVQEAMGLWMGIAGTSFNLLYGGPVEVNLGCGGGQNVAPNAIVFNDPCGDIADLQGCSGTLAFGGPLGPGSTHTFDGRTWMTASGWIVVVNGGAGCLGSGNYRAMLAHELGHGLGFGHVEDTNALMFRSCCNAVNGTDGACALYAYPARDPANERPSVDAGGNLDLALGGNTVRLRGAVSDDGIPAVPGRTTVQWRQVGGPAAAFIDEPAALETDVSFPLSGTYQIRLSASDGDLLDADVITASVIVNAGTSAVLTFREGEGTYSGTVDTFLQQAVPGADNSTAPELSADADDPAGSGQSSQILLRFDGIFGPGAGQIPPGASILSASLEMTATNNGNGARLHRMAEPWEDGDGWSAFGGDGVQAGREALPAVDATASGAAALERIDVTASIAAWSEDPCSNFGWAFLPAGGNGWDFESSEGAEPPRLTVEIAAGGGDPLVAAGDSWRYFKGPAAPPGGWNQPAFDDSSWLEGPAGIGYGDGDDETELDDMRNAYRAVFLRREFEAGDLPGVEELELTLIHDDGAVAYVNGQEVGRANMPDGAVGPATEASAGIEAEATSFRVPASLIADGVNVLAVSVHNAAIDSSDLSFSAVLVPRLPAAAVDCEAEFRRGDATADGSINITDAISLLGHLFLGTEPPACPDAADADDSGRLVLTDAIAILGFLFQNGVPLAEPAAACGRDPEPDALGDCSTPGCAG
jgi:hypothetical protein